MRRSPKELLLEGFSLVSHLSDRWRGAEVSAWSELAAAGGLGRADPRAGCPARLAGTFLRRGKPWVSRQPSYEDLPSFLPGANRQRRVYV